MDNPTSQPLDALFVGYEDQENLGLRSIIALLESKGYRIALAPFRPGDPTEVIEIARARSPAMIGFSIIFQYTLGGFAELAAALRKAGIGSHFTVGGHFPSMRPEETLQALPEIDSVVRFEGELTALELLEKIHQPETWPTIQGLAFRRGEAIILNEIRPLIPDLDILPPPKRDAPRLLSRGVRATSILASRGCLYNCTFCSIRQFYGSAPGALRRVRSPENVVAEMADLYARDGVQFFIFQDDDFASKTQEQQRWLSAFLHALREAGLVGKVHWKLSCRVDEVDEAILSRCMDHGLIYIFLGVEAGSATSLKNMNKRITAPESLAAIRTLEKIGVGFDISFMLLEPDSTLDTIQENVDFLREAAVNGPCAVSFWKMLPYAGTPVEIRLRNEGRLTGTLSQPNYTYLEPRIHWYENFMRDVFHFRNFDVLGLAERLRSVRLDQTLAGVFEPGPWVERYHEALRQLTIRANSSAFDALEEGVRFMHCRDVNDIILDWTQLGETAEREWQIEAELQTELDDLMEVYCPEMLHVYSQEYWRRKGEGQKVG